MLTLLRVTPLPNNKRRLLTWLSLSATARDARPRRCANIEEWGYHHGPEEHQATILVRASSPYQQYRM